MQFYSVALLFVIAGRDEPAPNFNEVAAKFLDYTTRFHGAMHNVSVVIKSHFDRRHHLDRNHQAPPRYSTVVADGWVMGRERLICRRYDRTQSSNHYEKFGEIVECRRDDLGFTLEKSEDQAAYILGQLTEQTGPNSRIDFAVTINLDSFLFATAHVFDVDGAFLFRDCASSLKSCKRSATEGRELIELEWQFDTPAVFKNYRAIRVTLDPAAEYSIAKYEILYRSAPGVTKEYRTGQVAAYRHPSAGCFVPGEVVIRDGSATAATGKESISVHTGQLTDYVFGKVTPADLSLERFGIPEPRRRGDARPASFWLLLVAGGLLLLGAGWRWLRRKRTAG